MALARVSSTASHPVPIRNEADDPQRRRGNTTTATRIASPFTREDSADDVRTPGQIMVIYHAAPGSPSRDALRRLEVLEQSE